MAKADCVNPGQEAAIAAAQQAETTSPTVVEINTCGGDDTSYQIPLAVEVTFDGQTYSTIYVTTNSVITFGRPDGTYWTYPSTPSISLYSMDWVVYPQWRDDEHLIIRSSDGGFQVDISTRPIWQQNAEEPTNIVITAAILSDGTVAMAYSVDGPTYDGQTRTGVRLNDGSIVDFETYGINQVTESPSLSPVATTESPFVPEPTESPTVSPETTESPTASPEPTESPTISPEPTESPTISPEPSESPTVSPEPTESPVIDPNRIVLIVNEGDTLSYVAPEGYIISDIESASYGADNGCHAVDSLIIVEAAATTNSLIISADNGVFGDPCGGTYKRLSVVLNIEQVGESETSSSSSTVSESAQTESPTQSPQPEPSQSAEPTQEPTQSASPTPLPTESPTPTPTPEPQPSPEPTQPPVVEPSPIPSPEPEPTPVPVEPIPTPSPEPEPSPTTTPEPTPTLPPTPEPTDTPQPSPTPSPSTKPEPTPTPTMTPTPSPVTTPTPIPTPSETPKPAPIPEPIVPEKPVVVEIKEPITSENIAAVVEELATVVPQLLTEEQQTLIVEAALETFNTAEPGSEEYEAALDALLIVAQADDIVIDEELAAVPLLGDAAVAAAELFNALGNAGADMSPKVREQSEKVVIAAVIVGQVAMTATAAAASAAVAARRP